MTVPSISGVVRPALESTVAWTPQPDKIIVLSDHGQTQGTTFDQRTGQTLAALVAELW